jgi:hypothetical protein
MIGLRAPVSKPAKILMQTTIPTVEDDWSIARFSRIRACLAGLRDASGATLFEVTARDRGAIRWAGDCAIHVPSLCGLQLGYRIGQAYVRKGNSGQCPGQFPRSPTIHSAVRG